MAIGRPRTTSFPPDEMIKLGEEMVEWVKKNNPIHLSQWYTLEKGFIYNEWKKFIEKEEFRPYYEIAIRYTGIKYLNGTIDKGIANRFLGVYFSDLRDYEHEEVEHKATCAAKENQNLLAPLQSAIDIQHENMLLKAEIQALKDKQNGN